MANQYTMKGLTRDQKAQIVKQVDELRKEGISVTKAMKRLTNRSEQCYYNWRKEVAVAAKKNGTGPAKEHKVEVPQRFEVGIDRDGNKFLLMRRDTHVEIIPATELLALIGATS